MDDLTFLDQLPTNNGAGNAIFRAVLPDGQVCQISDRVDIHRLLDRCPLLEHTFEYGFNSCLWANIKAPSASAVIMLLRYCYTGSYLPFGVEYASLSLLPHAEMYKMAENFNMPELRNLVRGNFICQLEFASSLPDPPQDLIETIRFVYHYFSSHQPRQQQDLINTVLHYCISAFDRLSRHSGFCEIFRESPEFRQDICHTNMERGFADDCAPAVIHFALTAMEPNPKTRPTLLASRDLPQQMLVDEPETPFDDASMRQSTASTIKDDAGSEITMVDLFGEQASTFLSERSTLVYRPKTQPPSASSSFEAEASSDEDGFTIVHPAGDELLSSPEIIPTMPIDILALTGSDYPSDDEWTLV